MADKRLVQIPWPIGVRSGWGLIGLHVALGLARCGRRVSLVGPVDPAGIPRPLVASLEAMRGQPTSDERAIRLTPLGNHFPAPDHTPNRVHVGLAVFEDSDLDAGAVGQYDALIAQSTWAQHHLTARGLKSHRWFQGFDETLFHPADRQRPSGGPFYVFSGGKLEFRKGQDIVVAAFRRFLDTPEGRDAVLVTAWQNLWPQTMDGLWLSGHTKGLPSTKLGQQDITGWLVANEIPAAHVLDVGMPAQPDLARIIRECDVALMPNRCEGATNMIVPEVLASAIPLIGSLNTGHLDSLQRPGWSLDRQSPVTHRLAAYRGYDGWGESDVEECVARLCEIRQSPPPRSTLTQMASVSRETFGWDRQCATLDHLLTAIAA